MVVACLAVSSWACDMTVPVLLLLMLLMLLSLLQCSSSQSSSMSPPPPRRCCSCSATSRCFSASSCSSRLIRSRHSLSNNLWRSYSTLIVLLSSSACWRLRSSSADRLWRQQTPFIRIEDSMLMARPPSQRSTILRLGCSKYWELERGRRRCMDACKPFLVGLKIEVKSYFACFPGFAVCIQQPKKVTRTTWCDTKACSEGLSSRDTVLGYCFHDPTYQLVLVNHKYHARVSVTLAFAACPRIMLSGHMYVAMASKNRWHDCVEPWLLPSLLGP